MHQVLDKVISFRDITDFQNPPKDWILVTGTDIEFNLNTIEFMINSSENNYILATNVTTPEDNFLEPIFNTSKENLFNLYFRMYLAEAIYIVHKNLVIDIQSKISNWVAKLNKFENFNNYYFINSIVHTYPKQYKYFDMLGGWYLVEPNFKKKYNPNNPNFFDVRAETAKIIKIK